MKLKWKREPLVFQKDGPYEEQAKRHMALERDVSRMYLVVAIPSILFLLTKSVWFILLAVVVFAVISIYKVTNERKMFAEYTEIQRKTWQELSDRLYKITGDQESRTSFAYLRDGENFDPVFVLRIGDQLSVYENIFVKNCVYGADSNMLYLMDLKEGALDEPLFTVDANELVWEKEEQTHQELLRSEGIRLNRYLIIEHVIYGLILNEMKAGKKKELLSMKAEMMDIRKEAVYNTTPDYEEDLLMPQKTRKELGLL